MAYLLYIPMQFNLLYVFLMESYAILVSFNFCYEHKYLLRLGAE